MEEIVWAEWPQTPYNWWEWGDFPGWEYYPPQEEPGYAGGWPMDVYDPAPPLYEWETWEELTYLKGCSIAGFGAIFDCTKEHTYRIIFIAGNIVEIEIEGPGEIISPVLRDPQYDQLPDVVGQEIPIKDLVYYVEEKAYLVEGITQEQAYYVDKWIREKRYYEFDKWPPDIVVKPYENAQLWDTIVLTVYTKLIQNDMVWDGKCTKEITIMCTEEGEECDCIGTTPTIVADSGTTAIARNTSLDLGVDSGGLACPDYTWGVVGTGFSLSKLTTSEDLEVNVLSADGTACGPATITVTDDCGVVDTIYIASKTGQWVLVNDPPGCGQPNASCRAGLKDWTCWAYDEIYRYAVYFDISGGVYAENCTLGPGDADYYCDDCCDEWVKNSVLFSSCIGAVNCYSSNTPSSNCFNVYSNISTWRTSVSDINRWEWQCLP